jgi:hypothetical protein
MESPSPPEIDEKKKAKFHGAFFYTERLHHIKAALDQITVLRREENSTKVWYQNYYLLMSLFKEIYPKMEAGEGKEREKHKEAAGEVKKQLDAAVKEFNKNGRVSDGFFDAFDEWEMELRSVIQDKGLEMPDKSDALDAMDL